MMPSERSAQHSHDVSRMLENQIPTYHTVRMKRRLISFFNTLPVSPSKAVLRVAYDSLFPSCGAAGQHAESNVIDERIRMIIELEEPDLLADLRVLNGQKENTGRALQYLIVCVAVRY